MGHKHSRHVQYALEDSPHRDGELPPVPPAANKGTHPTVQYAMQVEVRGDTGVGKTSLSKRLQGEELPLEYVPTKKTEHSEVVWTNLEDPIDSVEVTILEVVENSSSESGAKDLNGSAEEIQESNDGYVERDTQLVSPGIPAAKWKSAPRPAADAVLLLIDPRRKSTLHTAIDILKGVAPTVDVLVLLNFADISISARELTKEEVDEQVAGVLAEETIERTGLVRVASCCCIDCYGLEAVYIFLRVPFLRMKQREHIAIIEDLAVKIEQASERCFDATLLNHEEFLQRCGEVETAGNTNSNYSAYDRANNWTQAVRRQLRRLSKTRDETSTQGADMEDAMKDADVTNE